jgi:2'-5' RNA ligase
LRLFYALWPDGAARDRLAAWTRAAHANAGGRAMRPQNLHLTLAFLGDVDAARVDDVAAAASGIAVPSFELVLDRAGYWPHNRIVWAGASVVPAVLEQLVAELRARLDARAVKYERKPFVPHVTLLREAHPAVLPALAAVSWLVERVVLVKSVPGDDYSIIASCPATPAA